MARALFVMRQANESSPADSGVTSAGASSSMAIAARVGVRATAGIEAKVGAGVRSMQSL